MLLFIIIIHGSDQVVSL